MSDKITKIGKSTIQHGKYNNRIYLMKLHHDDFPGIIEKLDVLAKKNNYSKIFAKIPTNFANSFLNDNYKLEAYIPNFFDGKSDAVFLGKFYNKNREKVDINNINEFEELLRDFKYKGTSKRNKNILKLTKDDALEMAGIYKKVFPEYPFPIDDSEYLKGTMDEHIEYFGIKREGKLVALSSSEVYSKNGNAEMTDFAVLPEHRGNGYALELLNYMEDVMSKKGIKTVYTIARLRSLGMNKTFLKNGYKYSGTLIQNTKISTGLESMNVLYKEL
ncbi:MAG: putative beta-lysine N-acetyltransferase [Fusobacteriota bacterium]